MFRSLRLLALLRRIAKALERSNELANERLLRDYPDLARERGRKPKRPKVVEVYAPTVADWNEQWLKDHPENYS